MQIENGKAPLEEITNDIFKHTFVDVQEESHENLEQPKQRDVFFFYNFSFDLPSEYYN